jgi:hypothetical protein
MPGNIHLGRFTGSGKRLDPLMNVRCGRVPGHGKGATTYGEIRIIRGALLPAGVWKSAMRRERFRGWHTTAPPGGDYNC